MARKSKRAALVLTPDQTVTLKELAASRTAPAREVERAKVLLGYAGGTSITELKRQLGFSRPMIYSNRESKCRFLNDLKVVCEAGGE